MNSGIRAFPSIVGYIEEGDVAILALIKHIDPERCRAHPAQWQIRAMIEMNADYRSKAASGGLPIEDKRR